MHVSSDSRARSLRWLLLLLLSLVALTAFAAEPREVGRVLVASGEVTATREGASTRALGRGDRLYEGDAITTGAGARVQIRLVDEGLVQLAADTEYRIQHYRTQGEERGAVTELVEGGLRTVTGAIGDDNPDDYQLDTPVATIGIRGTHFALHHGGDRGTVGEVAQGAIVVENDGGAAEIGAGQFFTVRSRQAPPEPLDQRPAALDAGNDSGSEGEGDGEDEGSDEEGSTEGDETDGNEEGDQPGGDPEGDEGDNEGGLPGAPGETDDDGFLSQTEDAVYSPGEDEGTRETVEEEANEDDGSTDTDDTVVMTPWYEDESLTQFGVTGSIGYSPPGFVIDGEEHPEAGTIQELSLTADGALKSMTYVEGSMDGDTFYGDEYQLVASEGAEPVSRGEHEGLGIHWGRWNLGDYEQVVDGETMISPDMVEGPPPGTDWHWLVMEDANDLMTATQYAELTGTADFTWAGGTTIRATNLDGTSSYDLEVEQFHLEADFDNDFFTSGTIALVSDNAPNILISEQSDSGLGSIMTGEDAGNFDLSLSSWGQQEIEGELYVGGGATVQGILVGENAEGAAVTFSIYTEEDLEGIEGVGALEKQ